MKRITRRTAVYAGTFDPVTLGHMWMIEQGSKLFDELIVAIGTNVEKQLYFPLADRIEMLRQVTSGFSNVRIDEFSNKFLVKYVETVGANFILRGIRNTNDYEYEKSLRLINSDVDPHITTVFLMPPREFAEVSSSVIRGLVGPEGWKEIVGKYVPGCVLKRFEQKLKSEK
jgi:pantetheine-phosphate adenylyltransferase